MIDMIYGLCRMVFFVVMFYAAYVYLTPYLILIAFVTFPLFVLTIIMQLVGCFFVA